MDNLERRFLAPLICGRSGLGRVSQQHSAKHPQRRPGVPNGPPWTLGKGAAPPLLSRACRLVTLGVQPFNADEKFRFVTLSIKLRDPWGPDEHISGGSLLVLFFSHFLPSPNPSIWYINTYCPTSAHRVPICTDTT